MKARAAVILGTFFGAGFFPWGPGTAGSVAAVIICILCWPVLNGWWLIVAAAVLYLPGVWAATECERVFRKHDPGQVVVDEVIGQWITLATIPAAAGGWKSWLAGLIIFRVLDITKPFPIRRLERLPGGWGIVTDDVLAGVYGAGALWIVMRFVIR